VFPLITPVVWTLPVEPGALALPVGAMHGPGVGEDCDTAPDAIPGPVWTRDAATGAASLHEGPDVGDALVMARALGLALAAGLAPVAPAGDTVPLGDADTGAAVGPVVAFTGIGDLAVVAGVVVALAVAEGATVGAAFATIAAVELAVGSAGVMSGARVGAAVTGVGIELGTALEGAAAGVALGAADTRSAERVDSAVVAGLDGVRG
jgi:hypothetical protein